MILYFFIIGIFSARPPQQTLDELVLGEWTIQATSFSQNSPSIQTIDYYITSLKESFNAKTFEGEIYTLDSSKERKSLVDSIRFVFDQDDYTLISVFFNETEPIANLHIESSQNGLATSCGNLLLSNYTYFLSILSYKAVELTVYDHEYNGITIYKMSRTVKEPKGGSGQSLTSLIFPLLILAYLIFGKDKQNNNVNDDTNHQENENNNGNGEQEKEEEENVHEKKD